MGVNKEKIFFFNYLNTEMGDEADKLVCETTYQAVSRFKVNIFFFLALIL